MHGPRGDHVYIAVDRWSGGGGGLLLKETTYSIPRLQFLIACTTHKFIGFVTLLPGMRINYTGECGTWHATAKLETLKVYVYSMLHNSSYMQVIA